MDAIRFHDKRRLRVKLIGKGPFNQFSSLPDTLGEGRHRYAAFLPIEMKTGLATFCHGFQPPSDGEVPIRLLESAVFHRIGRKFVQDHCEGLDCAGAQPNASGSDERDRSILSFTNALRG
jgi:hypothetical protein